MCAGRRVPAHTQEGDEIAAVRLPVPPKRSAPLKVATGERDERVQGGRRIGHPTFHRVEDDRKARLQGAGGCPALIKGIGHVGRELAPSLS